MAMSTRIYSHESVFIRMFMCVYVNIQYVAYVSCMCVQDRHAYIRTHTYTHVHIRANTPSYTYVYLHPCHLTYTCPYKHTRYVNFKMLKHYPFPIHLSPMAIKISRRLVHFQLVAFHRADWLSCL